MFKGAIKAMYSQMFELKCRQLKEKQTIRGDKARMPVVAV